MDAKKFILCILKGIIFSVRISFRFVHEHPFLLTMLTFMIIQYRFFPLLFGLIVSSFPVIVCTSILLGVLLSFGEPNIPEIDEQKTFPQELSSVMAVNVNDNLSDEKVDRFSNVMHEAIRDFDELQLEEQVSSDTQLKMRSVDENFVQDVKRDEVKIHAEKQPGEKPEFVNYGLDENGGFSFEKAVGGVAIQEQKEFEGLKVEFNKPVFETQFDSSLGSPWHPVERVNSSTDSEYDREESTSPDASLSEIIPMLDELHPLLDDETMQTIIKSANNSDSASGSSSEDQESNVGSGEEEALENQVEEDDDDDNKEEKVEINEEPVKWTADDQKNLMDLGTSELERNRRLESLIAKRRARKNVRVEIEKNLIDLDGFYVEPIMEHLTGFQIRPISAMRRNPFDFPYDSYENMDLPPIPGSAPSSLLPRRNPFDLPEDMMNDSAEQAAEKNSSHAFVSAPPREAIFRRHETFSVEPSYYYELREDMHDSRSKPTFVFSSAYQRQSSGNSDSKVSPTPGSNSSSDMDKKDQEEVLGQEVHHVVDSRSPDEEIKKTVEIGSRSFKGSRPAKEASGFPSITSIVDEEITADNSGLIIEEIKPDKQYHLRSSEVGLLECVIVEDFDDSASQSISSEEKCDLKSNASSSYIPEEKADEIHVPDPVYDSSPSAVEKTISNAISLDTEHFFEGKGSSYSSISSVSDMNVEVSEFGLPPIGLNKNILISGEDNEPFVPGSWVASASLSCVDKIESHSMAVSEIREDDVIGEGYSGDRADLKEPVVPAIPDLASIPMVTHSSFSSIGTDLSDDGSLCVEAGNQSEADERMNVSYLTEEMENGGMINSSSNRDYEGNYVGVANLSTIPEEFVEDNMIEQDYFKVNVGPNDVLSDVLEPKEFHFLDKSTEQELSSSSIFPMMHIPDNSILDVSENLETSSEVHSKLDSIEEIDEQLLLLEKDAVGDFELPNCFPVELNPEQTLYKSKMQILDDFRLGSNDALEGINLHFGLQYGEEPESFAASQMQVLEVRSHDDIKLALEKFSEGVQSEALVGAKNSYLEIKSSTVAVDDDIKIEGPDSQVLELEARSVEDIELASQLLNKSYGNPANSDDLNKSIIDSFGLQFEAESLEVQKSMEPGQYGPGSSSSPSSGSTIYSD